MDPLTGAGEPVRGKRPRISGAEFDEAERALRDDFAFFEDRGFAVGRLSVIRQLRRMRDAAKERAALQRGPHKRGDNLFVAQLLDDIIRILEDD